MTTEAPKKISPVRASASLSGGFHQVMAYLRDQMLSGELKTGDILLPERELAAALSVSRPVLREALRALSLIGAVEIRHGVGTLISRPTLRSVGDQFAFILAQDPESLDDIMEARIAIELRAIQLACERATATDYHRLDKAFALIESTIDDPEGGAIADFRFHEAIVLAAHSASLGGLYSAIEELTIRSHGERRQDILQLEGIESYLIEHHRKIQQALIERDQAKCSTLLSEHFSIGRELYSKSLQYPKLVERQ